jgi:hypothetical protein
VAVRVRSDGRILCAAMHPAAEGDTYLDDGLHYKLSVELKALVTEPFERHAERGEWWWRDEVPEGVEVDGFYLDADLDADRRTL